MHGGQAICSPSGGSRIRALHRSRPTFGRIRGRQRCRATSSARGWRRAVGRCCGNGRVACRTPVAGGGQCYAHVSVPRRRTEPGTIVRGDGPSTPPGLGLRPSQRRGRCRRTGVIRGVVYETGSPRSRHLRLVHSILLRRRCTAARASAQRPRPLEHDPQLPVDPTGSRGLVNGPFDPRRHDLAVPWNDPGHSPGRFYRALLSPRPRTRASSIRSKRRHRGDRIVARGSLPNAALCCAAHAAVTGRASISASTQAPPSVRDVRAVASGAVRPV